MSESIFPQLTEAEQDVRRAALILLKHQLSIDAASVKKAVDFAAQVAGNQPLNLAAISESVKLTVSVLTVENRALAV